MDPQLLLPPSAGLVVEQVRLCDEIVHLTVRCEAPGSNCAVCGAWSEAFHSSYERNLGDLPIAGRRAVIDLRVRRFRCYQPECPRKTFVEQAPILAERYAHRTRRLRSLLEDIGLALGGRPGSRHCTRLAIPTSRTTLLRMVRALPERSISTPTVLGVDEFALRRGRRYGTILVDAEAHRIVDLLEDPSADALVDWLGNHPGAQVICRDRDGVYASAARRGAPDALQVADRWHLVHNLADALERFAVRVLAALRKELKAEEFTDGAPPPPELPPPVAPGRLIARNAQRHAEIHELMAQGLTVSAIARGVRLDRNTAASPMLNLPPISSVRVVGGRPRSTRICLICRCGGTRASTWRPFCSTKYGNTAIVAASAPSDARSKGGVPSSRHHRRMRCCQVRVHSPGCCCDDHLTWMRKSRCS